MAESKGGEMPREGSKSERVSEIVVIFLNRRSSNIAILSDFSCILGGESATHYTPQKKKNWYFCEARKQTLEIKEKKAIRCYIFALCVKRVRCCLCYLRKLFAPTKLHIHNTVCVCVCVCGCGCMGYILWYLPVNNMNNNKLVCDSFAGSMHIAHKHQQRRSLSHTDTEQVANGKSMPTDEYTNKTADRHTCSLRSCFVRSKHHLCIHIILSHFYSGLRCNLLGCLCRAYATATLVVKRTWIRTVLRLDI